MARPLIRRRRSSVILFGVVIALFAASCASDDGRDPALASAADESGLVDVKTAHDLEQFAVAECMKEHGFGYVIPSFQAAALNNPWHFLLLADADELGYHGTYTALVYITPGGEPPDDLPRSEMAAYTAALTGRGGVDEPDTGIRFSGCQAVGKEARAALDIEAEDHLEHDEIGDAFARVRATSDYGTLAADWSYCLTSKGLTPRGGDPVDHARAMRDTYWQEATGRMVEIGGSADPGVFAQQRGSNMVLDLEWFESLVVADDVISAIFDEEREIALADEACRGPLLDLIADS